MNCPVEEIKILNLLKMIPIILVELNCGLQKIKIEN
jgi:hypothetical protein